MKIGIMQPYFFPYLGYFTLIKHTERFILLDFVQFAKKGWIRRNRILKPGSGWQYISVPLIKYSRDTKIRDIRINNVLDWRNNIFRQLEHYKKRAPFYRDTIEVLKTAFNIETESIVQLNVHALKTVCGYIGVGLNLDIFSEMHLSIGDIKSPDEWALNICEALGNVSEYWNPEGGLEFYDRSKYCNAGIDIRFLSMNIQKYPQGQPEFEARLSIVDIMMLNKPEKINEMLDDYMLL